MQDWLSHRVRTTPGRTALVRAETGETLDFATLDTLVDDLAGRLAALGVESGDHLGMVMETRLAAVCTVHAAERLGAVLVVVGDDRTVTELSAQLDVADVTTLVCSAATEARAVEAFSGPVCSVDDPATDAARALGETEPVAVTPAAWDLAETRLVLFTSGTTGQPKAVRLTVGNLLWSAVASAFRLGLHEDDRWLVALSLHHMGGLSPVLRMPLYGMAVVLQESFDAGRTADNIGNHDVTGVSLVPTMLARMLDLRGTLADSLRIVLLGGAPAPESLIQRCRDFSIPLHPTYGMTETASQVATATPREAFADIGTVGRPLFWTTVTVRDPDGAELPAGETGEFVVDGPTVSPGYYGASEAAQAAFGPHGLRTGDIGYRDEDGRLFVEGRVDDRIITGGENVYPHEVADVLRTHPQVVDAAVVGVPDDEWGERVGALVVASDDQLTVADLDAHCRERLAGFKLPRAVSFADELPRTESGTVEREAVRSQLVEGATVPDAEEEAARVTGDDDPDGTRDDRREAGVDEPVDASTATTEQPAPSEDGVITEAEQPTEDGEETTAADDDDSGDAETVLFSGEHWTAGRTEDADDSDEFASDVVTNQPSGAEPSEEPPETPDFLQDAFAVDETGAQEADQPTASTDETVDAPANETGSATGGAAEAEGDAPSDDERTDSQDGVDESAVDAPTEAPSDVGDDTADEDIADDDIPDKDAVTADGASDPSDTESTEQSSDSEDATGADESSDSERADGSDDTDTPPS